MEEYNNALAGDYLAQVNTSFQLRASTDGAVQPNRVQSCAWARVVMASGSPYVSDEDAADMRQACGPLSPAELDAATARQHVLQHELRTHRPRLVAVPEIGFDPRSARDEQSR